MPFELWIQASVGRRIYDVQESGEHAHAWIRFCLRRDGARDVEKFEDALDRGVK